MAHKISKHLIVTYSLIALMGLNFLTPNRLEAQQNALPRYEMGTFPLTTFYVAPEGDDQNDGFTANAPLRTITAAWERIPRDTPFTSTGYRILIAPGDYTAEGVTPHYWEARYGTAGAPLIIEVADPGRVFLPPLNLFDLRYVYFLNLKVESESDPFHCERCDHLLLRGNTFKGAKAETFNTQEVVKINQSQHVYLEDNTVSGGWDNAVDFVAVQYGHVVGNRISGAGDWCIYAKGGSAYLTIAGNDIWGCGTGGFSAGQGTGFQFMVAPWLQYEAYALRFYQNVVRQTEGAGVGVQGGYDILIAYNTFFEVGRRSHVLEVVFGGRTCDGQPGDEGRERCDQYLAAGGWGSTTVSDGENHVRIPNKNVYIFNNVIYNPPGFQSQWQHFAIFGPFSAASQASTNAPNPAHADENLIIKGNLIWNGTPEMPLGIEDSAGCAPENLTCNRDQLLRDNAINTEMPVLQGPVDGWFNLVTPPSLPVQPIPDFPAWDVPVPVPESLANSISAPVPGDFR